MRGHTRGALLLTFLFGAAASLPLARAESIPLELPVVERTLDNGLRILVLEDHTIPNAALYVGWRVGSRNERPGITGLAHFFEHMMFSGGKVYGHGRFDPVMEAAGGSNNAYTTNDVTVYSDWFPAARLPLILDMESDRMHAISFKPDLVATERGVVASERRLTVEDPAELLREQLWAAAYTAHPYQWPVLGWMTDIQSWKQEDLETFFKTHYAPNNCVMVLVGDVKAEEALAEIVKRVGDLPRGPEREGIRTQEPPQLGERRVTVEDPAASAPQVMLAWHIPATDHPDFPALVVLEQLLLGGESSRLERLLVQDRELCLEVGGGVQGYQFDPSLFTVDLVLREDQSPAEAESATLAALGALQESGPTPEELEKVKRGLLKETLGQLRTIDGKASLLADTELFFGGWRNLGKRLDAVQAVSAADVQRVMKRYLYARNRTVATLSLEATPGPEEEAPEAAPTASGAQDPADAGGGQEGGEPKQAPAQTADVPPPLPARPLSLPDPVEAVLDNGLHVLLVPDPQVPLISLRARILGGSLEDPVGQRGLAQIVAGSLLRGAGERDAATFQEAVEGLGGELTSSVAPRWIELQGEFLARDADTALGLLADVLRAPRLEEAEIEHDLGVQLSEVAALRDDPAAALPVYWRRWEFGAQPLGGPAGGDEASLQAIQVAQVQAAARRELTPGRVWLAVAGAFEPEALLARIKERLGDWKAEPAPPQPAKPSQPLAPGRVLLVDDPEALQTYFMFGGPLFRWTDPDYPARLLANTVLGGRFTGRLNTALRIETGLTYGAYSEVKDDLAGALVAKSYTAVATSRETIELARDVYARFVSGGITQAELDSARSYLQGQLAPDLIQTAPERADLLLDLRLDGLSPDVIRQLFTHLDQVDLKQVNAVIGKRFPHQPSWVLIGPAAKLREVAGELGEVTELSLTGPGFAPVKKKD